jgi:hypothetical protein
MLSQMRSRLQGVNTTKLPPAAYISPPDIGKSALGELPRSGKPRRVSDAAIAWVQNWNPMRLSPEKKFKTDLKNYSAGK